MPPWFFHGVLEGARNPTVVEYGSPQSEGAKGAHLPISISRETRPRGKEFRGVCCRPSGFQSVGVAPGGSGRLRVAVSSDTKLVHKLFTRPAGFPADPDPRAAPQPDASMLRESPETPTARPPDSLISFGIRDPLGRSRATRRVSRPPAVASPLGGAA